MLSASITPILICILFCGKRKDLVYLELAFRTIVLIAHEEQCVEFNWSSSFIEGVAEYGIQYKYITVQKFLRMTIGFIVR